MRQGEREMGREKEIDRGGVRQGERERGGERKRD